MQLSVGGFAEKGERREIGRPKGLTTSTGGWRSTSGLRRRREELLRRWRKRAESGWARGERRKKKRERKGRVRVRVREHRGKKMIFDPYISRVKDL